MFVEFFLRRPVLAAVCSLALTVAGALAIPSLPISQYPDLALPQLQVVAYYVGASAQEVERAVTTPLEQELNGITGMRDISSVSSSEGVSAITITFDSSRDLEIATVDVQNRVARASTRLPEQVTKSGIRVNKALTQQLCAFGVFSEDDRYDAEFLTNYADLYIRDALKRIPGIRDVVVYGAHRLAMRIWLDPAALARHGLIAQDVRAALNEQNVQVAAGKIGAAPTTPGQPYQMQVRAYGRLEDPDQFGAMVIKRGENGKMVRLEDVARVELGAETYQSSLFFDGHVAIGLGIFQQDGSNSLEIRDAVVAELARLSKDFPPGLVHKPGSDTTLQVRESMKEVTATLLAAIALVILVIFLFLHGWRAVTITVLTLPVSLLGAFAFVWLFDLSINTLTLFGLILATGLVVDDAIVVLENIERTRVERGLDIGAATRVAMRQVTGAVLATSIVLVAVFVPVALFPSVIGIIYRQFALTIAAAIALSTVCALTLTPALAALLLHGSRESGKWFVFRGVDRAFGWFRDRYIRVLRRFLRRRALIVVAFLACMAGTLYLYRATPTGFIPDEDQALVMIVVRAPEGTPLAQLEKVTQGIDRLLATYPEVKARFIQCGISDGSNIALVFAPLKPWDQRPEKHQSVAGIVQRLSGPMSKIREARVIPIHPPAIRGVGNIGGFELIVQDLSEDRSLAEFDKATRDLVDGAGQDKRLSGVFTTLAASSPVVNVEVDRERAKVLGVPINQIYGALQLFMGSEYVNDFNYANRTYRVYLQADAPFRNAPDDIGSYYVRSETEQLIPLETFTQVSTESAPPLIRHHNLFRAAEVNGKGAPGVSSGQAMQAMEDLASRTLPGGMTFDWTGLSREEKESGSQTLLILVLGLSFVFLVLAAQYESFRMPFVIILAVPLAVLGGVGLQFLRGLTNDVFCQVGLVMLIGLAAKNAILIVEFAEQRRREGATPVEAVVEAASLRLRPILMTSIAFLLGVSPLLFASGAGAAARTSLGTVVFGGMLLSMLVNLLFTPGLYLVVRGRDKRGRGSDPSSRPAGKHDDTYIA